jgi:outer membrane protein assembly factor BamA
VHPSIGKTLQKFHTQIHHQKKKKKMRTLNDLDILLKGYPEYNQQQIHVTRINVQGSHNTRESTVKRAFKSATQATTLSELSKALNQGISASNDLNVHKTVVARVDADENDPNGVVINVSVTEKERKPVISVGAEVTDRGTVTANAACKVRSLAGFGEEYAIQVDLTPQKNIGFVGKATVPMYPTLCGSISLSAYTLMKERVTQLMQSSTDGISLSARINPSHEFIYRLDSRKVSNIRTTADDKVPVLFQDSQMWGEVQDQSISSSVTHVYTSDNLDDPIIPSSGYKLRLNTTYSGIGGGNTQYIKHFGKSSFYIPVKKNWLTTAFHTTWGIGKPENKENTLYLNDRFTHDSIRGYQNLGEYNPNSNEEYGGNVLAVGMASLIAPVPVSFLRNELGMHVHAFFNTGNVDTYDFKRGDPKQFWEKFRNGLQSSYGVGVMMMFALGRVEFNYCRPYMLPHQTLSSTRPFKNFEFRFVLE